MKEKKKKRKEEEEEDTEKKKKKEKDEETILARLSKFRGVVAKAHEKGERDWLSHELKFEKEEGERERETMKRKEGEFTSFDPLKHKKETKSKK